MKLQKSPQKTSKSSYNNIAVKFLQPWHRDQSECRLIAIKVISKDNVSRCGAFSFDSQSVYLLQAYLLLELLSNPVIISVATYMKICQMVFKKHPLPLMWWNEFGNRNTLLSVLHFILKDTDYASEGLGNNDQTTKESALNSFRLWNTIMCVIMCCIHIYINIALVSPSVTMSVKPYLHMKDYGRTCYIVTITCFFWYERKF